VQIGMDTSILGSPKCNTSSAWLNLKRPHAATAFGMDGKSVASSRLLVQCPSLKNLPVLVLRITRFIGCNRRMRYGLRGGKEINGVCIGAQIIKFYFVLAQCSHTYQSSMRTCAPFRFDCSVASPRRTLLVWIITWEKVWRNVFAKRFAA